MKCKHCQGYYCDGQGACPVAELSTYQPDDAGPPVTVTIPAPSPGFVVYRDGRDGRTISKVEFDALLVAGEGRIIGKMDYPDQGRQGHGQGLCSKHPVWNQPKFSKGNS